MRLAAEVRVAGSLRARHTHRVTIRAAVHTRAVRIRAGLQRVRLSQANLVRQAVPRVVPVNPHTIQRISIMRRATAHPTILPMTGKMISTTGMRHTIIGRMQIESTVR